MSKLSIFQSDSSDRYESSIFETVNGEEIAERLSAKGVRFERWPLKTLADSDSAEEVLSVYEKEVRELQSESGFVSADVVRLTPDHPDREAFRTKFLSEHQHVEDEVRFFVEGSGLFYLHLDEEVWVILCEQGDLISVPDGVKHWFDMGPKPLFTCIRLFSNPEGWVAEFTGYDIAARTPAWESLMKEGVHS
jgi:1,2-dihydroxy-3-keto-5-methylthiopentene dioxygenase